MDTFEDFLKSDELKELKIKYSDFDKNISYDEINIIFQGIDKTDFTYCGVSRWRDLDEIISIVYNSKENDSSKKLKKVLLVRQIELWPPINYYHYEFY
jgi:hypothetical protein